MTCPKVGCRVWVREKAIPNYARMYEGLDPETLYAVVQIEKRPREVVYLRHGDRIVPVWRCHVKPLPRCEYCNEEGHTKSRATKKNCPAVRLQERTGQLAETPTDDTEASA